MESHRNRNKIQFKLCAVLYHRLHFHFMNTIRSLWHKWIMVGWLIGFYGTAYIGYIAPVSVVNVRMSAHAGLVGSYHLAPSNSGWILLPHSTGGTQFCILLFRSDLFKFHNALSSNTRHYFIRLWASGIIDEEVQVLFKKWIEVKCILLGYEQHLIGSKRVKSEGLYTSFEPTKCCSYPDNMHLPSIHNLYLYQLIPNARANGVYRWFVCRSLSCDASNAA